MILLRTFIDGCGKAVLFWRGLLILHLVSDLVHVSLWSQMEEHAAKGSYLWPFSFCTLFSACFGRWLSFSCQMNTHSRFGKQAHRMALLRSGSVKFSIPGLGNLRTEKPFFGLGYRFDHSMHGINCILKLTIQRCIAVHCFT